MAKYIIISEEDLKSGAMLTRDNLSIWELTPQELEDYMEVKAGDVIIQARGLKSKL